MLSLNISSEDLSLIEYERYHNPSVLIQKRLHTLYLKSETDLKHKQIAEAVGIHKDTVTDYIKLYQNEGLDTVLHTGYGTNKSELDAHKTCLLTYFETHPPHSISEAIAKIKELTGIERKETQVRHWLKKTDLSIVKQPKFLPKPSPKFRKPSLKTT